MYTLYIYLILIYNIYINYLICKYGNLGVYDIEISQFYFSCEVPFNVSCDKVIKEFVCLIVQKIHQEVSNFTTCSSRSRD